MRRPLPILATLIIIAFLTSSCSVKTKATMADAESSAISSSTTTESSESASSADLQSSAVTAALPSSSTISDKADITQKTKNYILTGQGDKPEAEKLKWSERFLNQVNIEAVYKSYIKGGGKADDIEGFAAYLTLNAPIPSNWKELFEADFASAYDQKITRYEKLSDNSYEVYVTVDGKETPFVALNARTGYYHG